MMILSSISFAQEVRTKTGFGYYDPRIGGETGNIFYTDIMVKIPSGYFLGAGFGMSGVHAIIDEDDGAFFENIRAIRNYYHFRAMIAKELHLDNKDRHVINLGTGLTYNMVDFEEPEVFVDPSTGDLVADVFEDDRKQDNAGFLFHADYGYRFGKFSVGVRGEIHYLIAIGLGGIIVSPQIGVNF